MRIPTSAIVMSVVTAVPFGLAIRDTITHDRSQAFEAEAHAAEAPPPDELALEAERERLAIEADLVQHRRADAAQLIGPKFVTPGPAFGGRQLGRVAADDKTGSIEIVSDALGATLAMAAHFGGADVVCSDLVDVAVQTWGEPAHDRVWLDLENHHRASIRSDCAVELARFDEPITWVARLPFAALGGSRAELAKRFASPGADPDAAWLAPGLDGGKLTTMWPVYDVTHPDKLLGLEITTEATPETAQRVIEALTTRIGAKPTQGGGVVYRWKSATVELGDGNLQLVLGVDDQ